MPDELFWDFNFSDYMNFSEQGLIKELPEGWEEKYPNLYDTVKQSGIYDYLKEIGGGKFYGFPRTTVLCSENKHLLTDILKKEWNYDGFVVSDWGCAKDIAKSISAGLDLMMPSKGIFQRTLKKLWKRGESPKRP